ncbi:MAG: hypothetical protein IIV05_04970, partial [Ruminococcus sp.]|nr:hypothetical protein [Ruminococcus sp.]
SVINAASEVDDAVMWLLLFIARRCWLSPYQTSDSRIADTAVCGLLTRQCADCPIRIKRRTFDREITNIAAFKKGIATQPPNQPLTRR